jgi:glycosyltransferase involved in cell wall biosynthesis
MLTSLAMQTQYGMDDILQWAFIHATGQEIDALDLLLARKFAAQEKLWLRCMNRYLASSGAKVRLSTHGNIHRFLSIQFQGDCTPQTAGPLVSVIMPVFNATATLAFAARSILQQSWQSLELILIDDASTDGSDKVCHRLMASDSRVKYHRNPINVGPYVSKNVALSLAEGDYVTCHDADDWAFPYRIEHQINLLMRAQNGERSTIGRMIRVSLGGIPERPCHIGSLSEDGFARKCFVSLMIARQHFDRHLGAWDNVRVSADSELLERALLSTGGVLEDSRLLILGLDNEAGLTRDPEIGIGNFGRNNPRFSYQRNWSIAHKILADRLYYPPYPSVRPFEVDSAIEIPSASLSECYKAAGIDCVPWKKLAEIRKDFNI